MARSGSDFAPASEEQNTARYNHTLRLALVALWIAWAALLLGGFLLGAEHDQGSHRMPTWTRIGSSLVLVLAGWAWWLAARGGGAARFAFLIAMGMTLGFVGDLFNAGLLKLGLSDPVLGGIACFGLGHVAYIWACVDLARRAGLSSSAARYAALAVWLLIGLAGWYFVAYLGREKPDLRWPALPYSLLLAGTAGMTSSLALQDRRMTGLALGGALFLLSDLILAFGMFNEPFRLVGDAVWLTYGPAQMLIVYSVASARQVAARPVQW